MYVTNLYVTYTNNEMCNQLPKLKKKFFKLSINNKNLINYYFYPFKAFKIFIFIKVLELIE